jgi:hypothetical protein
MIRAGDVCWRVDCQSTNTRAYITGPACDQHAPWAHAARVDPRTQIDPAHTEKALRKQATPLWAKGATDIAKERPGGYMSKQRAERIAAERDATSTLQHPTEERTA